MDETYGTTKHIRMSKALAREISSGAKDKKTSEAAYIRTAIEYFSEQDRLMRRIDSIRTEFHADQIMQSKLIEKQTEILVALNRRLDEYSIRVEEIAVLLIAMSSHQIFR